MKKFALILCLSLFSMELMAQKIDSAAIVKAGMSKLIKDYSTVCYNDSAKVNVRWYTKGSDTIAQEAAKEPPKGYTYLEQKEMMLHRPFQIDGFLMWIVGIKPQQPKELKK